MYTQLHQLRKESFFFRLSFRWSSCVHRLRRSLSKIFQSKFKYVIFTYSPTGTPLACNYDFLKIQPVFFFFFFLSQSFQWGRAKNLATLSGQTKYPLKISFLLFSYIDLQQFKHTAIVKTLFLEQTRIQKYKAEKIP